jgi:phosphomannomutase
VYQLKLVSQAVFRAYDIRGVINHDFNEDAFYSIGRAIGNRLVALARKQIFITRDGRLTSLELAHALRQGLLDSGIDVIDLGAAATPVMYYATHATEIDCGLMVTGSHNPANYNGIKMVLAGKTLMQADIDLLYAINQKGVFVSGHGQLIERTIINDYIMRVLRDITLKRRLKVVVDCGNGIAGPVIPDVIRQLGCEVIELYCEVDGCFPNHHPDPTVEANLADLKTAVSHYQADIGLAFDGDADRLGVVTNKNTTIWPDRLMMYYAKDVLKQQPGATVVFDVKCSSHLTTVIEESGGVATMCPTGHSIVKSIMKVSDAVLAGEMSGHLFFRDKWYGFDDALYSACRLLEIVSQSDLSVEDQFASIPDSINTPEIKIAIDDDEKFLFMSRFSQQAQFDAANIIQIDGLRVEFVNGWGLIRASNTTPCLVARFEASDKASLVAIQDLFKIQLLKVNADLVIPF